LFAARKERLPGSIGGIVARAGQVALEVYLREAQAYMLISMPTDTSTIIIHFSQGVPIKLVAPRATLDAAQGQPDRSPALICKWSSGPPIV
jgi:hypothetical protein